jgi:thiol-disulfide isomerase/thioredoxin
MHVYAPHMPTRLLAGLILVAGLVLLAVVALGNGGDADDEVVAGSVEAATDASNNSASGEGTSAQESNEEVETTVPPQLTNAPENFGPRRDLVNLDGWLNTDITDLSDLDGKVVLVEMWTFGCRNCKARIPHNQDLYASTSRDDFEIVGVHAPEFSFEAELTNIENAVVDLGITWPVALDTEKTNFRSWQDGGRRFWPRTYVIDQNGDVRYDHIGEGRYEELNQTVNWLIENPPA